MWLEAKDLDWYKRNVHQDMVSMCLCIHDEVDLVVDAFLMEPIMVVLNRISESKNLFDRFGMPYINFYFDNEYDQWGTFTALKTFNPYKYEMDVIIQKKGLNVEDIPKRKNEPESEVKALEDVDYKELRDAVLRLGDVSLMDFVEAFNKIDKGDYRLILKFYVDGKVDKYIYEGVDIKKLEDMGVKVYSQ